MAGGRARVGGRNSKFVPPVFDLSHAEKLFSHLIRVILNISREYAYEHSLTSVSSAYMFVPHITT